MTQQTSCFVTRLNPPIQLDRMQEFRYNPGRIANQLAATGLDEESHIKTTDNFDGKGLANYLGPYALAFVLSIAVTAGFVKFVLMDY